MELSELFKALSDPTRLLILRLMIEEQQSLCVCEIVTILGIPQYQVSRHLSVLKQADLVQFQKIGTWAYHYFNDSTPINQMLAELLRKAMPVEKYQTEFNRLRDRLALRFNGKCVVGFEEEKGTAGIKKPARKS
ncbi:MAG: metalloregulator ArsR/SmtB family transcription factor [Spirochaetia bacterium]|jgi:ArsR family transcriptional regulator|uniref:Putative transcriptional regulator n=1 Tax=uncultured spirochete TaxID=156406 RepID=A0A3P3XHC4_9SPIR|nr:metalloregulator ArsR/SmtB family transcription factor [Spirochaetia bacterium]SLM11686.1 putative transcriptional regulator [uncultured spirochete]HBE47098.1 ArsR family transcriptional regulator [Spirochaetaceae bacterium]HCX97204.1 ArsR family transcriptional regulator [Spirochaetaceae bacterium]